MTSRKPGKPRHRVLRSWWNEGRGTFPGGPPPDLPEPGKVKPRGRGQPPKVPAGTWEDHDDLLVKVSAIVGKDRRDRKASGPTIVKELQSMAARWLGRTLTTKEHDRLLALTLGQQKTRRALGRDTPSRTQPVKASAIVRELLSWRYNVTDPDVRRMQRSRRAGRPPVKMIFR